MDAWIDIEVAKIGLVVEGTGVVKVGSLPHSFPDGDPVLKQFFLTVTAKDGAGKTLAEETRQFGLPYDKILRGPIPDPFIKGGNTRKVPFSLTLPVGTAAASIEAVLTYSLLPMPDLASRNDILRLWRPKRSERRRERSFRNIRSGAF